MPTTRSTSSARSSARTTDFPMSPVGPVTATVSAIGSAAREPVGDRAADLLARILLKEVRGVLDLAWQRRVDGGGEPLADLERDDEVGVGPQGELRTLVG